MDFIRIGGYLFFLKKRNLKKEIVIKKFLKKKKKKENEKRKTFALQLKTIWEWSKSHETNWYGTFFKLVITQK